MNDKEDLPPTLEATPEVAPQQVSNTTRKSILRTIFVGPNGIRAGWRILIYIALVAAMIEAVHLIRHHLFATPPRDRNAPFEPVRETISRVLGFLVTVVAAWIMARIEREKWGHYGLPLRRAVSKDFWIGILWGFVGVSLVMAGLWMAGAYRIEGWALTGTAVWKYAALWGVMFLVVGLLEEFTDRGYLQYALASGIGFWPAAVIGSALFFAGHLKNPGENWMGLTDLFLNGLFLCFTLWRTGDLWFAVGMHAAWDWGLTYFYSVPNSGTVAVGHLFNVHSQGPAWLTGGSAGPEGSIINLTFDLLCFVVFAMIYKKRKWIGMDDRRLAAKQRARSSEGGSPLLDSSALSS